MDKDWIGSNPITHSVPPWALSPSLSWARDLANIKGNGNPQLLQKVPWPALGILCLSPESKIGCKCTEHEKQTGGIKSLSAVPEPWPHQDYRHDGTAHFTAVIDGHRLCWEQFKTWLNKAQGKLFCLDLCWAGGWTTELRRSPQTHMILWGWLCVCAQISL